MVSAQDAAINTAITQHATDEQINYNDKNRNMSLSLSKSYTMVFSLRFYSIIITLACNNIPIPIVSKIKYLWELHWTTNFYGQITAKSSLIDGRAVNLIEMLSSTHRGNDPITLALF